MPEARLSLEKALASYDPTTARAHIEEGERERAAALERFPLTLWPTMPLERYALGQPESEDSFCRWMEFRTPHLGSIRGGNSQKLLIYKHKDKPGWYFSPHYKDEQDAWLSVRGAFVEAFQKAQVGEWNSIDDLAPLYGGPALRLKTLSLYFPTEVLPVFSSAHIRHFLQRLQNPEARASDYDAVRLNRALLAEVRQRPQFSGWSTAAIERFLYYWTDPRDERRIVKIAPGDNAKYWEDCLREGYICVGWDSVGDLREFETKDAFRVRFGQEYGEEYGSHPQKVSKKANELWTLKELEAGDIVIANKGTSQILAVGTVAATGYAWRSDRPEYRHTVGVDWDESYARAIPQQKPWAFVTVAKVKPDQYEALFGDRYGPGKSVAAAPEPLSQHPILRHIADALERKGQVALYGPPGTGKTYQARRFAVAWLLQKEGRFEEAHAALVDAKILAAAERELATPEGATPGQPGVARLTHLTFHPSYSYEDFVEGFRPVLSDQAGLSIRLEDGVFKRLCQAASAQPKKPYLLLIDELNRANVAKVFGELITLLEVDKRGLRVTLPQSKTAFSIPPNVYILGTMNTADRSIKLLDAALRRRFAFIELMPDIEALRGATIGALALDDFLETLNAQIARTEGREKQIGHSFLLEGGLPITDPDEFARRFRQEILPLLQEYCYDDYAALASFIGDQLVDKEAQRLDYERLNDSDALLAALEEWLRTLEGGVS